MTAGLTLSDAIWLYIIWAIYVEVLTVMSAQIMPVHNLSPPILKPARKCWLWLFLAVHGGPKLGFLELVLSY